MLSAALGQPLVHPAAACRSSVVSARNRQPAGGCGGLTAAARERRTADVAGSAGESGGEDVARGELSRCPGSCGIRRLCGCGLSARAAVVGPRAGAATGRGVPAATPGRGPVLVAAAGEGDSLALIDDARPLTEHVDLAFAAREDATARAFDAAALAAGYEDLGGPRERRRGPTPGCYGADRPRARRAQRRGRRPRPPSYRSRVAVGRTVDALPSGPQQAHGEAAPCEGRAGSQCRASRSHAPWPASVSVSRCRAILSDVVAQRARRRRRAPPVPALARRRAPFGSVTTARLTRLGSRP